MKDLLSRYSASEILFFCAVLAIAIKEFVQLYDWFRARIKQHFDAEYNDKKDHAKIDKFEEEKVKIDGSLSAINEAIVKINKRIDMLIDSDKERIKSEITKQHHYFVEIKHCIDYHSMSCLEKQFEIYGKEHGNSFVEDLMNEIRALPKRPICDDENNRDSE